MPARKSPAKAPAKAPARKARAVPQTLVPEEIPASDIPSHPPETESFPPPMDEPMLQASPPPEETAEPKEKVDPVKIISFIESILGTLTFRTVGLVALLTVIGLGLFGFYENRDAIVKWFTRPTANITTPVAAVGDWTLSEASKQSLMNLAKATSVRVVVLSDVDLKKNRRTVRYYFIEDNSIQLQPLALQALALPLPVFDYDAKNTEQMIAVLSNDFRCDAFADTVYNRFAPYLSGEIPMICRLAVPPFVGTFVGFVTVGVAPGTSPSELETIRLEVSRIAVEIYMNDVTKKTSPAK